MSISKISSKGFKDILSLEVISFVLKIGLGSIFVWSMIMYIYWGELLSIVSSYLTIIPWEWLKTTGSAIATVLIIYIFMIITISILTSLFSEKLLKSLAKKHYNIEAIGTPNDITSIIITLKSIVKFIILFVILFLFIFIPIIGQIVMLYLWSILLRDPTVYDVGTLFIDNKTLLKQKSKKATTIAMIASLFNYIPILNIFAPIYAQILFLHHILEED
jgi:uncharacterized protein involved in cysteine biosynthesis